MSERAVLEEQSHLEFTEEGLARDTTIRASLLTVSIGYTSTNVFITAHSDAASVPVCLTPEQARYIAALLCARAGECEAQADEKAAA